MFEPLSEGHSAGIDNRNLTQVRGAAGTALLVRYAVHAEEIVHALLASKGT